MTAGRPLPAVIRARRVAVAVAVAVGATPPAPAPAQPLRATDLGAQGIVVRGTVATASTSVSVPAGYAVVGGTIDVRFAHSPLLRADRSTVTVLVDDVPLRSTRLLRSSARAGRLRVGLPALPDARRGFALSARFAMHLTRDDSEDPRNPALWARLLPTTRIDARLVPAGRTVGQALTSLAPAERGDPLHIGLPDDPSAAALAAAGTAVAALGRANAAADVEPLVVAGRPRADRAGIEAATGDDLAGALARIEVPRSPPAGSGILAVAARHAPRLVVGGADERGLVRAAAALAAPPLTPSTASVSIVRGAVPAAPLSSLPWRRSAASLAQLGIGPREVTGSGPVTLDVPIDRPPSWTLREGGELDLVVDAAAGLRGDASSLTVDVGGQRVGTRRLPAGRGPVHLRFALPAGPLNRDLQGRARRSVALRLGFDLAPRQVTGAPLAASAVRATILETSKLTLPHETTADRDLGRFPAPLTQRGRRLSVVVPADPSAAELTAGLQVAAAVGRWAEPAAPLPRLLRSDDVAPAGGRGDLVLVGRAAAELGARATAPGGAPREPGEGGLALRPSPWDDARSILLVAGADDDGLVRTARALAQRDVVERLTGSAMRIAARTAPVATAAASPAGRPPVELAPVLEEEEGFLEALPIWAIPAAVVLGAFLSFVVLLVRHRVRAAKRL